MASPVGFVVQDLSSRVVGSFLGEPGEPGRFYGFIY
jgi:hypothetical protein